MKKRSLLFICILAVCCFALAGCGDKTDDPLKVSCNNGVMVGQAEEGIISFLGVPYAEAPVGELRWKAPVPAADSDEEIICDDFGYTALQYEWPTEPASYEEKSEDCLTLNIWKSEEASDEPKAVMVWFHGGSHAWGGTADPMYNGENFVKAHPEVILVTANYRLGMMSWADFTRIPGGEEYTDLNLGIRDHLCALEWVQKNIEQFGGDAGNVTIFGESAGGMSTADLLVSPMSEGLFNKVIIQSGGLTVSPKSDGTAEAQEFADVIMEASGCKTMDELNALTTEELLALDDEYGLGDYSCGSYSDGVVIPYEEDLEAAFQSAADRDIKLMLGANGDEWNYFMTDSDGETNDEKFENWKAGMDEIWEAYYSDNKDTMDKFYEIQSKDIAEEYAKDENVKDALIKSSFITETWRLSHTKIADMFSDCGGETYMYYWDVPSTSEEYYKSACHAIELAYVFNNLQDTIYCGDNPDKATAQKAHSAWASFATAGNPSTSEAEWTAYDSKARDTMMITLDGWTMQADPYSEVRKLITKVGADIL